MAELLTEKELSDFCEQLEGMPRDADRLRLMKRVVANYKLEAWQVRAFCERQCWGASSVETAVLCFPVTTDPENYAVEVLDQFKFAEDRDAIKKACGC